MIKLTLLINFQCKSDAGCSVAGAAQQTAAGSIVTNGIVSPGEEEGVQGESAKPEECDVITPFLDQESHSTIETSPSENEVQMVGKRYFILTATVDKSFEQLFAHFFICLNVEMGVVYIDGSHAVAVSTVV